MKRRLFLPFWAGLLAACGSLDPANMPRIDRIEPQAGVPGVLVTIHGVNFGDQATGQTVQFQGAAAVPQSWSDSRIVVPVPSDAVSGRISIQADVFTVRSPTFTVFDGSSKWVRAGAGYGQTCALQEDGSAWCWGRHVDALRRNSDSGESPIVPARIGADRSWRAVFTGGDHASHSGHTCLLSIDDELWCWGYNRFGQLGNGEETNRSTMDRVAGRWQAASAGTLHTCGIQTDASLWCWGNASEHRLGTGTDEGYATEPQPVGAGKTWRAVSAGAAHTCAIDHNDTLSCWGANGHGQLGTGESGPAGVYPTAVSSDTGWSAVSAGAAHTCGVRKDGTLWCWGRSLLEDSRNIGVPSSAQPEPLGAEHQWVTVSVGRLHACALNEEGELWCWGANPDGRLGVHGHETHLPPTRLAGEQWTSVTVGDSHTCARKAEGTLWCWGGNWVGQLGDRTREPRPLPVRVTGG